jgi:hypothetical protein
VADCLLGADLCDILRECTLEPLERGPGSPSELGDLTSQAGRGLRTVLGKGEEDQDAGRGLKGSSPPVQFGGGILGL